MKKEVIRRRLNRLDEYLVNLDRSRHYSLEAFLSDPERYGSAERFLQLAQLRHFFVSHYNAPCEAELSDGIQPRRSL